MFCLIQCYLTLLYESIKLMVPDQPRENAHKTETNWGIIVLINWPKSSITHNVLNLFRLTQHKLSHPKYWWPKCTNCNANANKRETKTGNCYQIYGLVFEYINQHQTATKSSSLTVLMLMVVVCYIRGKTGIYYTLHDWKTKIFSIHKSSLLRKWFDILRITFSRFLVES